MGSVKKPKTAKRPTKRKTAKKLKQKTIKKPPTKRPAHRPTKLTNTLMKKICGIIAKGTSAVRACAGCGISRSVFYDWQDTGRKEKERRQKELAKNENIEFPYNMFVDFLDNIELSNDKYLMLLEDTVRMGVKRNPRLALDVLARKLPKEWGKKDRLDLEGDLEIVIKYPELEKDDDK